VAVQLSRIQKVTYYSRADARLSLCSDHPAICLHAGHLFDDAVCALDEREQDQHSKMLSAILQILWKHWDRKIKENIMEGDNETGRSASYVILWRTLFLYSFRGFCF